MSSKKDYDSHIDKIINNIGGKENIKDVTHCATRLRFILNDESIANTQAIEQMDFVMKVIQSGGQYQVVIGPAVTEYFDILIDKLHLTKGGVTQRQTEAKQDWKKTIIDFMAGVFFPIFNLLATSGILKGILSMILLTNSKVAESGIYQVFNGLSDALFLFLPIFLGYTTAKKIGLPSLIGVLIGAALCYPKLNGVDLNFWGHGINVVYTSSFLPVIFIVLLALPIYHFFNKIVPDVISSFTVPLLTLAIVFPIGFTIIGPISNALAVLISNAILSLYGFNGILTGIVIGVLWQILVMFGLHGVLISVVIVNLFNGRGDLILATSIFVAFAQTATVAAIATKTKNQVLREKAFPAIVSGIFGITEPAIYGITLPRMKMFITSCISGGIAGGICGFLNVKKYATGSGIFALPTMINPKMPEIMPILITFVLTIVIAYILALVVYKDSDYKEVAE